MASHSEDKGPPPSCHYRPEKDRGCYGPWCAVLTAWSSGEAAEAIHESAANWPLFSMMALVSQ
jgi:hypothetical protein